MQLLDVVTVKYSDIEYINDELKQVTKLALDNGYAVCATVHTSNIMKRVYGDKIQTIYVHKEGVGTGVGSFDYTKWDRLSSSYSYPTINKHGTGCEVAKDIRDLTVEHLKKTVTIPQWFVNRHKVTKNFVHYSDLIHMMNEQGKKYVQIIPDNFEQ